MNIEYAHLDDKDEFRELRPIVDISRCVDGRYLCCGALFRTVREAVRYAEGMFYYGRNVGILRIR